MPPPPSPRACRPAPEFWTTKAIPSAVGFDGFVILNEKVVEKPPATGCSKVYQAEPAWFCNEGFSCSMLFTFAAEPFNCRFAVELKSLNDGFCESSGVVAATTKIIASTMLFVLIVFSRAQKEPGNAIELSSEKARTLGEIRISQPDA